jgi:hypothetical protein
MDKPAGECTLILTNESPSKITRLIRINQSQALKLVTEDGQTGTDRQAEKVTYSTLGSSRSHKFWAFI